jgi:hypothetical protein
VRAIVALVALAAMAFALPATHKIAGSPPPAEGYFQTVPAGSPTTLPDEADCTDQVHRSNWEPRPGNAKPNQTMPDVAAVHSSLATRPRSTEADAYDPRWDSWLLARVTGQHEGTTDENIQWAACKWGLSDNLVRAVAVVESTWYQRELYPNGACVEKRGCGDLFPAATAASREFCAGLKTAGYDYQRDYGAGLCPKTFSIVGVMSWHDPAWGQLAGNQNGTFPFNRDSTAFAVDYLGSDLRGCIEGWERWLVQGTGFKRMSAKDRMWGCVGAWYAGEWHSAAADGYIARVRRALRDHVWRKPVFATIRPPCASAGGCVSGSA